MNRDEVSNRIREFEQLCKTQGLPVTVQRRAIFEAVVGTTVHPAAEDVFTMVKDRIPGISRTTVYRALEVLSDVGLINRLPHPTSTARFDGNTTRHHHMVCRGCGQVWDVFDKRFDSLPTPTGRVRGFRVEDYSITFTGTCADCRSTEN